jgi:hypothetical protein
MAIAGVAIYKLLKQELVRRRSYTHRDGAAA